MHHLAGALPHHRMRDLAKKYGPIIHLQLGEFPHIVVSSPETAKQVMKTHDVIFAQRPSLLAGIIVGYNCTDLTFAPYGEYWRQVRKISMLELLTAKRVQSFKSIREEQMSKLIREMSSGSGSPINFSKMVNSLTYNIISTAAFGKVWSGEEMFIPAVKKVIEAAAGLSLADLYPSIKLFQMFSTLKHKLLRVQKELDEIFQNIIDEHRARRMEGKPGLESEEADFVDVLLRFQDQEDFQFPVTDEKIKAIILDMFIAGSETSTTTLIWAMSEMMKNPRVIKKAQAEVRQVFNKNGNIVEEASLGEFSYLKAVTKETLRLHPPVPVLLPRECKEDCQIDGYDIPAKSRILVNAGTIGRDPNYWTEAEKFYPERFLDCSVDYKGTDFEFIPFGAGRRMCPGMWFGIANVEFPLAQLLYYFDWKLPNEQNPEDLDMAEEFGAVITRKNDLRLIPTPYIPSLP
ncbi:hypothetical protein JCGZ_01041 [Jatropha curcas]|uniref:Cytochrome P450 n=2 Tax=Jatropha curcas TaxID=180498 RepID=A0A067L5C9_JATCU|nr:hypothetical protein JCGZ_01041 [Jatropha curcas]